MEYKLVRPHSSVDNLTLEEYALKHEAEGTTETHNLTLHIVLKNGAVQGGQLETVGVTKNWGRSPYGPDRGANEADGFSVESS